MKIYILSPLVFVSALFCASSAFAFDWKSETGEIVIPANTEAVVTDDDMPDVEKLTKITIFKCLKGKRTLAVVEKMIFSC